MNYSTLVQKNKQYNQLLASIFDGKFSAATLLKSVDADFIAEIAISLACKLVGASPEIARKGAHPDILIYGTSGKIDVSAVTEIIESLALRPYSSNKKIYCLLGIENMNETSQNKLLKSLEEPPEDVYFLMTTSNVKQVLPTVLSRSNVVEVDGASSQDIFQMLVESGVEKSLAQIAESCSAGNSTLASKLTTPKFAELYNLVFDALKNINGSKDCLAYASKFEGKDVDKNEMLDIAIILLRDASVINANAESLVTNNHHMTELKEIAGALSNASISSIISECLHMKEDLYYNGNTAAIVDKFVLMIAQEKTKCRK